MTIIHNAVRNGDKERMISVLETDPSSINQKENGYTPLHLACRIGHAEIVKELINRGADVKTASENGYTPVHTACRFGHAKIVEELIKKGADVKVARPDYWSPIHSASWAHHSEVVNVLLKNHVDPNKHNSDGWNALHLASMVNNDEIVGYLLDSSADVCIRSTSGETALDIAMKKDQTSKVTELLKTQMILKANWTQLHIACYQGHSESVLDILKNGSSVDECNKDGCTALHLACEKGHHTIVETLLKYHARVDIKDKDERTPLHTASHYGHIEVVKLLVFESTADTNIVDKNGDTAVGIALRNKRYEVAQFLEDHDHSTRLLTAIRCNDCQAVEVLLKENTDTINGCSKFGCTALHYASRQGYENIVKMLIDKNANVDIQRKDGWTALQSASSLGYTKVVCHLLRKSQSVNKKNEVRRFEKILQTIELMPPWIYTCISATNIPMTDMNKDLMDGMTALHYACKYGHHDIVRHLIDHGADINIEDFDGMTALDYACKYGHHELEQLLNRTALMKPLSGMPPSPGAHGHAPNVPPDVTPPPDANPPPPDAHPDKMATSTELPPSPDPAAAHVHAPHVSPDVTPPPDAHPDNMATSTELLPSPDPAVYNVCLLEEKGENSDAVSDCESFSYNIPDDLKKSCCDLYTIHLDEKGCTHTNERHGFSLIFPQGALLPNHITTLTIGVMMYGPFLFPDNVKPISPILWVCGNSTDVRLLKNAKVVLPHFLDIDENDDRGIKLLFLKAHANHNCVIKNKMMYIFKSVGNAAVLEGHNAELFTSHFCCICLGAKVSQAVKERMLYCITLCKNKANSMCEFAVTYLLKTCLQTLKTQCKDMDVDCLQKFEFKWDGSSKLNMQYSDAPGWQLAFVKGKEGIELSCLDFWNIDLETQQLREDEAFYPPRFVLQVRPTGSIQYRNVLVTFSGINIQIEIALPLQDEAAQAKLQMETMEKSLLNISCSEEDIYTITAEGSGYDFDWRRVGRRLLSDQKVRDIDHEKGNEEDKKEKMLLEWKRTKSRDATYEALVKALRDTGSSTTADRCGELQKKSKSQVKQ